MANDGPLRLLIISDIHCIGVSRLAFSRLAGDVKSTKEVQAGLGAALARFRGRADHVLFAGDFTENGKPHQYDAVLEVLAQYGPEWFCAIPGNHDTANVNNIESWNGRMRRFKQLMEPYLPGFPGERGAKEYFPYVRRLRCDFALMGLDTTLARTAQGRLGEPQLALIDEFLNGDEYARMHKIILMHHDAVGQAKLFNGFEIHYGNILLDAADFLDILKKHEASERAKPAPRRLTVISGHTHLKRIDTESIPGVTFMTAPGFGSRFEEDFLAVELYPDGSFAEFGGQAPRGKSRMLRKYVKYIVPKIHT
jgi:3',5'-cyclic AMP phosphodiesterase CpdA